MSPRRISTSALLLVLLSLGGCARSGGDDFVPRSVVFVTFDTLSLDYVGLYTPSAPHTPNLDRIAAGGAVFDHAYTPISFTLPAHTILMSGASPMGTGVMLNDDPVPTELETLPEIFSERGYRTGAFISLGVLDPAYGLESGFEQYDNPFSAQEGNWYRSADQVMADAVPWIEEVADEPFFAWIHLSDPHEPYRPVDSPDDAELSIDGVPVGTYDLGSQRWITTEVDVPPGVHELTWRNLGDLNPATLHFEYRHRDALKPWLVDPEVDLFAQHLLDPDHTLQVRNDTEATRTLKLTFWGVYKLPPAATLRDAYGKEVAYADHHLGELWTHLEELGVAEEAMWVFASDHGEGLYQHGHLGHGEFAHEEQQRILWAMRGPGIPSGARYFGGPVLNLDVAPTLLDTLGLPIPETADGQSQTVCWTQERCALRDEWWGFGGNFKRQEVTSIVGYRWPHKVLWFDGRGTSLYDLQRDPGEEHDWMRESPEVRAEMPPDLSLLGLKMPARRAQTVERFEQREERDLSDAEREMLKALGYL